MGQIEVIAERPSHPPCYARRERLGIAATRPGRWHRIGLGRYQFDLVRHRLLLCSRPRGQDPRYQTTGTLYSANTASIVTMWQRSASAWAIMIRSHGSRCGPGSAAAAIAWA